MRAVILAAGRGMRLQQAQEQPMPKCLLRFGGQTLLERHLLMLRAAGVADVVLALGFEHRQVEAELDRLAWTPRPRVVINEGYELGSVLTVHTVADAFADGAEVLLMDADVLYDQRIAGPLTRGAGNLLLIDRDFEAGEEPVKLCVKDGVPVELRKRVAAGLDYDTIGESVGFFRFDGDTAGRLAAIVAGYVEGGRADQPHEEAVRDLLLEGGRRFGIADVTGAPWIEIDFPTDIRKAADEILPSLQPIRTEA